MKEVIMTEGTHIEYTTTKKSITFGDDDLMLNLKNRERDEDVMIDVCADRDGYLVLGASAANRYVAQVLIPAREYVEEEIDNPDYDPEQPAGEGNPEKITTRTAVPFDSKNCTIYLYALGV